MKSISFVIPVYNEEKRIHKALDALERLRLPAGLKLEEVIFVDDGSTDHTRQFIKTLIRSHETKKKKKYIITLLNYNKNRGKGYAVRLGMQKSIADYTLFFDADMSTPLSELQKFLPRMMQDTDVIIGTRKNGTSTVTTHQPLYREMLGRGFTLLTNLILGTSTTDFTCGFKAFSKSAKAVIFTQAVINRWSYDAEIVYLAKKHDLTIEEVAVRWAHARGSRVNVLRDIFVSLIELIAIRKNDIFGTYSVPIPLFKTANTI